MNISMLTVVVFLPAMGALIIALFVPKTNENAIKLVANAVAFVDFALSLVLLQGFEIATTQLQHVTKVSWIPQLGIEYFIGIDGISLLLVILTTGLGFIAVLSSWTYIQERLKEYYAILLLLQTGILGVFVSFDFFLFYVFWEVMLVPMYFLIGIWGDKNRLYAAIKFFLYTLFGSVLMLLGIIALYLANAAETGVYTFNILEFYQLTLSPDLQWWIFLAFFLGFAIKVPMFPFHTWLPDAHVQAPTAGSVILAGVLLKMGTYGFIRLSLPILPDATRQFVPMIAVLSIIAIIYGGLVALMQKDWKSLVAYSSVSHMGFITLGIFMLNPVALQGGIFQMLAHGVATGGLFLIVGLIYERMHTKEIARFSGLAQVMPVYATMFAIIAFASLGMPTLNGFIGEFLVLAGTFQESHQYAFFAVWGVVLAAAYLLWLYQRVMLGEVKDDEIAGLKDLNLRESMTLIPLVIMAIVMGVYPKPFLEMIEEPVNAIVERVRPGYFDGSGVTPLPLPSTPGTAAALPVNAKGQLASLEDLLQQQLTDDDKTPESSEN
ncbi:MAG: NADH-quinone oxidoreductase subunit M [Acidobacteriota bacterium]|jgi:NADH-quinone oxidoreductase subunit M|nr:NADH-quinone oxidoreductase subunit M [Acidobacteriota bacterium]|tara:strand:- start:9867 stop:11513 length:1647 start_codon:yes stop_codon:yes gene_type:complete